ncbi:RNA polymerase sigma factor [Streptomyces toxytricini]|uniref:RNA polymerase sigma factor n=1 Tax=Streptomyces toxytricini TaxID=67369 RepID=A0ABW8EEU9_STRT5
MMDLSFAATPCLGCTAPVDLLDLPQPPDGAGGETAEYLDPSRWCDRCLHHLDDWDRFFRLYQPRVRAFCLDRLRGLLPDNEDHRELAEDIAQEVMVEAYRHFGQWERPERALWTTARNKIHKKCAAYRIVTEDGYALTVRHAASALVEDPCRGATADPAQAVVDKVVLYSALSRLPVSQQEAVVVHKAFQVSAAAAGSVLERPGSTVKTQAERALALLREAAAKGALIALPGAGLFGLYKVLQEAPLKAVAEGAVDVLGEPAPYTVLVALAAKQAGPYLGERYGALRERLGGGGVHSTRRDRSTAKDPEPGGTPARGGRARRGRRGE